jgi:hypothetical protein
LRKPRQSSSLQELAPWVVYLELALEKAFLVEACAALNQSLEGFKKKHLGGRPTRRSKSIRS